MRVLSDADVVACLPPVTEVIDLMAHGWRSGPTPRAWAASSTSDPRAGVGRR